MLPLDPSISTLPPDGPAPGLDRPSQPLRQTVRHLLLIATGLALWFLFASILLPKLKEFSTQPPMPTTKNSMKQWGIIFKMYANESKGELFPQLAPNPLIWAPDLSQVYPEYLNDPSILVARDHPDAEHLRASLRTVLEGPIPDYDTAAGLMGLSFAYLGHAVTDESGFEALLTARRMGMIDGSGETVTLPSDGAKIFPLREEIGCDFLGKRVTRVDSFPPGTQSTRPILVETWQWKLEHDTGSFDGAQVLYMDGHVAWLPLGTFPVVSSVMDALCGFAQDD